MPKPLANWEDNNSTHENLVWWTRLDDRYQVEVHRNPSTRPQLLVFDREQDMEVVHSEDVTLAYDARFGPDVDDVIQWQECVINVIDNPESDSRSCHIPEDRE
jgi:hypothetical protein